MTETKRVFLSYVDYVPPHDLPEGLIPSNTEITTPDASAWLGVWLANKIGCQNDTEETASLVRSYSHLITQLHKRGIIEKMSVPGKKETFLDFGDVVKVEYVRQVFATIGHVSVTSYNDVQGDLGMFGGVPEEEKVNIAHSLGIILQNPYSE